MSKRKVIVIVGTLFKRVRTIEVVGSYSKLEKLLKDRKAPLTWAHFNYTTTKELQQGKLIRIEMPSDEEIILQQTVL